MSQDVLKVEYVYMAGMRSCCVRIVRYTDVEKAHKAWVNCVGSYKNHLKKRHMACAVRIDGVVRELYDLNTGEVYMRARKLYDESVHKLVKKEHKSHVMDWEYVCPYCGHGLVLTQALRGCLRKFGKLQKVRNKCRREYQVCLESEEKGKMHLFIFRRDE